MARGAKLCVLNAGCVASTYCSTYTKHKEGEAPLGRATTFLSLKTAQQQQQRTLWIGSNLIDNLTCGYDADIRSLSPLVGHV